MERMEDKAREEKRRGRERIIERLIERDYHFIIFSVQIKNIYSADDI